MADSAIYTVFPHFFFNDTATTEIYTLSLHDALPILRGRAITYRLRSTTTYNTAREKVMENATLRAVRAIRAVHCEGPRARRRSPLSKTAIGPRRCRINL